MKFLSSLGLSLSVCICSKLSPVEVRLGGSWEWFKSALSLQNYSTALLGTF